MGRPKGYDPEEALERAMDLFWAQGFDGTSTQELVEHLGINRNSMYSEFGSKREFYETALRHYEDRWLGRNFGPLERDGAGLDDIRSLFEHYAVIGQRKRRGLGCMLTNSLIEFGAADEVSMGDSKRFLGRVRRAFRNALAGALGAGELRPDVDASAEADYLTSTWLGLLVMARGKASKDALDAVSRGVDAHLDRLMTG